MDLASMKATLAEAKPLSEDDVIMLLRKLMEVLYMESNVVEVPTPAVLCGDIHGQLYDLFELFDKAGGVGTDNYVFMGDYVDRGRFSLETVCYLAILKLEYPDKFFLLRGNHESRVVNQFYGFYEECQTRYGHSGVWMLCNEMFDLLPMAALVDRRVFAVHGGLSPDLPTIEKISLFNRNEELPSSGALCDLCWSDPDDDVHDWRMNQRGAGYVFGIPQIEGFCRLNGDLELITRSHQLVMEGIKWCGERLATVWSAPNYMYRSGNIATVMRYKGPGEREVIEFGPREDERRKLPDDIAPSSYFL